MRTGACDRDVVVAEDDVRRLETSQERTQSRFAAWMGDEVAGHADEVRPALGHPRGDARARAVATRQRGAEVEVRQVSDPQPVQGLRKAHDGDLDDPCPEPAGLQPNRRSRHRAPLRPRRPAGTAFRHPRDAGPRLSTVRRPERCEGLGRCCFVASIAPMVGVCFAVGRSAGRQARDRRSWPAVGRRRPGSVATNADNVECEQEFKRWLHDACGSQGETHCCSSRSGSAGGGVFARKSDSVSLHRPHYAYGVLRAADVARYFGLDAVTVCEFGVASGDGLVNLVDVAELVTSETGIRYPSARLRHRLRPTSGAGVQGASGDLVRRRLPHGEQGWACPEDAWSGRGRPGRHCRHRRCVHRLADAIAASRFRVHRRRHLLGRPKRPAQPSRSVGEASSGSEPLLRRCGVLLRQRRVRRTGSHPRAQRPQRASQDKARSELDRENSSRAMACAHVRLPCARSPSALSSSRPHAADHPGSRRVHERVTSPLTVIRASGLAPGHRQPTRARSLEHPRYSGRSATRGGSP